jgi:fluoroquinolone transport system permease protein
MPSAIAVRGMLRTDVLRMLRDRFLIGISAYIFFVVVVMRAVIPWATTAIAVNLNFDLTPYHPLIVSHLTVQLAPLVPGIVGGFLLLESREEGTVKALLVSPSPLFGYVSIACTVMFFTGLVLTFAAAAIIGLGLPPWPALFAVSLAGAPGGPAFALLIAAVANNKVQAFAYMKIFGLGPIVATGAYFLPGAWKWLAIFYPPYWASRAYWVAEAGGNSWPLWAIGGMVVSAIWVGLLQRLFLKAARR